MKYQNKNLTLNPSFVVGSLIGFATTQFTLNAMHSTHWSVRIFVCGTLVFFEVLIYIAIRAICKYWQKTS